MAQSLIQEGFKVDFYATPKQLQILKEITKHTRETIEQYLSDSLERALDSEIECIDILGMQIKDIWRNGRRVSQRGIVNVEGRTKIPLEIRLPSHKLEIMRTVYALVTKYRPTYFQYVMEDDTRALLEVIEEVPDDVRKRLHVAWKKEIGH